MTRWLAQVQHLWNAGSKLYKNGKFELELVSGEMARNTVAFLFALDRENKVQV